ncbi:MAG: 1,4-alpha-glucan branching protein GlgB [Balneolales bacterium]
MKKILAKSDIEALGSGTCNDPFSILGLHSEKADGRKQVVIRTMQPHAKSIDVKYNKGQESVRMNRISDSGIFETTIPDKKESFSYYYEIEPFEGQIYTQIDAYAFPSLLTDFDLQLWGEGNHIRAYNIMGAHPRKVDDVPGTHFVVSAPDAFRVSVIGSFNDWDGRRHPMRKHHEQGVWEIFLPGVGQGDKYKYEIKSHNFDLPLKKSDPYGFYTEKRPATASIVHNLENFTWSDEDWMTGRSKNFDKPLAVYELHLGSWKRDHKTNDFLSYRQIADDLIPYVTSLGYTHIELLPISEHPYDLSWGYQTTGYYSATSRFGSPDGLMYLINECHRNNLGVLVDWVPAHFAKDDHGLRLFDGTHLYEHADPRQGEHKDWGTHIFNFGRTEVINFLLSNAMFWCDKYHIDGIRADAVASMIYLDYSREEGEWIPNKYGGNENLEAVNFLKRTNEVLNQEFEGVITMAEESTNWPMVSRPTYLGGLGFDYKWNMGWMNDTLKYFEVDPLFRRYHHNQITFSMIYAFTENFALPFSHDEVVHGKKSMISKMPGDNWQKFANLRLLYTYMYAHPGKKILFMGNELAQWSEWSSDKELDWHLLNYDNHKGVQALVKDLNHHYKEQSALHEVDFEWQGFEWIDASDVDNSILSFLRYNKGKEEFVVCIFNFTPQVHYNYKFGVPKAGAYEILVNSDSHFYCGSNVENHDMNALTGKWHNQPAHLSLSIPPLSGMLIRLKSDQ